MAQLALRSWLAPPEGIAADITRRRQPIPGLGSAYKAMIFMSPTLHTLWLHGKQVTITVNTTTNAQIDAPKTDFASTCAGRRFRRYPQCVRHRNNWPYYEGLLGNANYYDHGNNQNGDVVVVNTIPRRLA